MDKKFELRSGSQLNRWRGFLKEAIVATPGLVGEAPAEVAAQYAARLADELFLQDMKRKSILADYEAEKLKEKEATK